jgi:hypothetical protein
MNEDLENKESVIESTSFTNQNEMLSFLLSNINAIESVINRIIKSSLMGIIETDVIVAQTL